MTAAQFGRKPALFLSSCTFALGSVLMAVAQSYEMLVYSRYIQGFGVGAGLLISPMFISEVSPKQWRGALVTLSEARPRPLTRPACLLFTSLV